MVFFTATISFGVLLAIALFVFKDGLPAFKEIGFFNFVFGTVWRPGQEQYGILTMIVGSMVVTIGSLLLAVPLGIACAILLAEVAPFKVRQILRPCVELLVGIPSVVYGLVGLILLVPAIRQIGGNGFSVLGASIVLMAMVLPTIISITEDSIRAVPTSYKEGAMALGSTHWQTIRQVLIPAARSGIGASIVLGMGRAVGETMAMIMVIGNSIIFPKTPSILLVPLPEILLWRSVMQRVFMRVPFLLRELFCLFYSYPQQYCHFGFQKGVLCPTFYLRRGLNDHKYLELIMKKSAIKEISPQLTQKMAMIGIWGGGTVTVLILVVVIGYVLIQGIPGISLEFLFTPPTGGLSGEGGISTVIVSTIYLVVVTTRHSRTSGNRIRHLSCRICAR
jgi:phosphate transport system permease protein